MAALPQWKYDIAELVDQVATGQIEEIKWQEVKETYTKKYPNINQIALRRWFNNQVFSNYLSLDYNSHCIETVTYKE